jgi:N-acetylmuramic acid 6-phosphate etherase
MSQDSKKRSADFLKIADQFRLGVLTTEASHPVTANLSQVTRDDIADGLDLLLTVDHDVLEKYREFSSSGRARIIKETILAALSAGGRLFFTGCGSTGRLGIQLVAIWRDFWQQQRAQRPKNSAAEDLENRAFAVMAGGDFALIKAVEGFEDFTEFGKKQIEDLGVCSKDVVFAITEGGETSFVIGTAWKAVEAGAKVYFVYNNPDDVLCGSVQRSREVLEDARIEKINLTTGPMAITGSTRMQATSIQLAVLLTILEMTVRELTGNSAPATGATDSESVPATFERTLRDLLTTLRSGAVLSQLARLTALEEKVYRAGRHTNYFADQFGIDVLTDTTERSPTYCTPAFRKFDDQAAAKSWAFLFVPPAQTQQAWNHIIKRLPRCVEWAENEVLTLVPEDKAQRTLEVLRKISYSELLRFKVGLDGLQYRPLGPGDCATAMVSERELSSLLSASGFHRKQLEAAHLSGASTGLIYFGSEASIAQVRQFLADWSVRCEAVLVPVPGTDFLLDGVTRVGLKMLLNALSTCTMVRLGRVMGNYMVWVVPSNLKLIDRASRYIAKLAGLDYTRANELLFEVIEYVEPRMRSDQAYPPVVGLAVTRSREGLDNQEAEKRLQQQLGAPPD